MIALSVTWYKLGARRLNVVTGTRMSFSHVLLRDGESRRMLFCGDNNAPFAGSVYFWYATDENYT